MILNIRKMQSGGGLPPFAQYTPVTVNNAVNAGSASTDDSSKTGDTDKGQITDKDLLTLLKDIDGLPSDMQELYRDLTRFYQLGGEDGDLNTGSLSTQYIKALQKIKNAKFNKEAFDKAYTELEKNGGINELAVSTSGSIMALDENGKIRSVASSELEKNPDKYQALTNGELLKLRAEDISYAGANDLQRIASNGIGMEKISELLKANIQKLGEDVFSREGYISGSTQEGLQLLNKLIEENGITKGTDLEGLYKAKIITKEQKHKIDGVLKYAFSMLPDNAKNLLKIKAGGLDKAYNLAKDMMLSTTSSTDEMELDYLTDKEGNKPGEKAKEDKTPGADLFSSISQGQGPEGTFQMMNADGYSMTITGTSYPELSTKDGNRVEESSLKTLLEDYGYNSVAKGGKYAITFGNQALTSGDTADISFMNDRQATRVILPTTTDAEGNIVPDLQFVEKNRDLIDMINKKGLNDPEVRSKMAEAGLISQYDGLPDLNKFQSYLCLNGMGTSRNIGDDTIKKEVTDDAKIDQFERAIYRNKKNGVEGKEYKFDFDRSNWYNPADWFGLYDKLYEGTIYIPVTESVLQTHLGAGTSVSQKQADTMEAIYQEGNLRRKLGTNNTSSDLLGL